jgi:hypothetical protein
MTIDILGPEEVHRQLDLLQGMAERNTSYRLTELLMEWLDLRFPTGNQYRNLVVAVLDTVHSYSRHSWSNPSGVPFHHVSEAIGRLSEALRDDPNALRIRVPREQDDLARALREAGLHNWHDPAEFTCVYTSGAPGTSGNDLSARMIVHKDYRAVLEVEVARLVEWAAWPTVPSALPEREGQAQA